MQYKMTRRGKTTWRGQVTLSGRKITRQFATKSEAKEWEALATRRKERLLEPQQTTQKTCLVSCLEWMTEYLFYAKRYAPKVFSEKKCECSRLLKGLDSPKMPASELTPGVAM